MQEYETTGTGHLGKKMFGPLSYADQLRGYKRHKILTFA